MELNSQLHGLAALSPRGRAPGRGSVGPRHCGAEKNIVTCYATEHAICDVLCTGDAVQIVTSFYYNFTSRHYNLFLQCALTL
jgi:hypothetical protein